MAIDETRTGELKDLQKLYADRTTEPSMSPIEAADAVDLATALTLVNEIKAKTNALIAGSNRRLARQIAAGIYVKQAAEAALGATVGLANNAAVSTLVLTKAELDLINAKVNAVLALFRTSYVIPVTGGSAIADLGATAGEAKNSGAATLVALKTEGDETRSKVNSLLAKLRLSVLTGVPADLAANVGLANNAAVATLVATKAEHDTCRAKVNAVLVRAAAVGILA